MIEWIAVFGSALIFGIANFRRKPLLAKIEVNESLFWEGLGNLPLAIVILFLFPVTLDSQFLLLCLASAFLAALAVFAFFHAVRSGYVSAATAVMNLNSHIAAFLAFFVFAEVFTLRIAFGILLAALVVILLTKSKTVGPGKWLLFAVASMAFFSLKNLIDKTLSMGYNPLLATAIISFMLAAMYAVPLVFSKRKATTEIRMKFFSNGILISIAFASLFLSFNMLPLSVAVPIIGLNTLVTALLGVYFLKEKLDRRAWLAIALAVVSVWLLAA